MMDGKPKRRARDFEADADEALAAARDMPPGAERTEALKAAGKLRGAADVYGIAFCEARQAVDAINARDKEGVNAR